MVFDKALELLAAGAAKTATGSSTGVLLYNRMLPTCDWVVFWSGLVATGTYALTLEVSDLVGGTYTSIAAFTIPPAIAAGKVHVAINGFQSAVLDTDSKFMRMTWTLAGSGPSAVLGSFLAKSSQNAGLGVRVGDFYVPA
jgi:hypothetical protein